MLPDLFAEYRVTKSIEVRNRIVMNNYGLAVHISKKVYYRLNRAVPIDDLIAEACIGLILAVETFDPSRTTQFSTLATPIIFRRIVRYATCCELNRFKFRTTSYNCENDVGKDASSDIVDESCILPSDIVLGNELTEKRKAKLKPTYQHIFAKLLEGWSDEDATKSVSISKRNCWFVRRAAQEYLNDLRGGLN